MSGGAHCVLAPPAARPAHHRNYDYINNKTHLCSDLHKIIKQTHSYNHLRYTGELFHSPVAQPVIDKTLHQSETVVRIQRHHDSAMGPPLHDITEGGFCLQNKRVLFFFYVLGISEPIGSLGICGACSRCSAAVAHVATVMMRLSMKHVTVCHH